MLGIAKTAVKYFVYGLVVGVLFAPQRGDQTRRMLADRFSSYWHQLMGMTRETSRRAADTASRMADQVEEGTYKEQPERGPELH